MPASSRPPPGAGAREILDKYQHHNDAIRLGLVLTMFASGLLVPWAAVISIQMQRIEGRRPVLAYTQMAQGALLSLEFIVPIMVWQTAAYRATPARTQIIHALDDMGWLMFVGVISTVMLQLVALGAAVLLDKRTAPIFPRWYSYFTLWVALILGPAGVIVMFRHGPFAWNGLFAFWIPLTAYCVWVFVTCAQLVRAIKHEVADEQAALA